MVLPLLGLLAATGGAAALAKWGGAKLDNWEQESDRKRYAGQMQGLLGKLPEGSGAHDTAKALTMGGMLSPEGYMQYGFPDDPFALEAFKNGLNSRKERQAIIDQYQPQLNELAAQSDSINNILGIAKEAQAMSPFDYNKWIGSPEGRAVKAQLSELEEQGFSDFKKRVYGEAEPPPGELKRLHQAYQTFTGGGVGTLLTDGRWDLIGEIYDRRLQENTRRAKSIERDFYRSMDSYEANDLMIPGSLGGEIDVSPHAGETTGGGVSMSGRNMPPLIQMESGGNWGATNDEGMAGRAQFSPERLDEVREGLNVNFSTQEFLRNPALQKAAEAWHFNDIEDYIQDNGLDQYIGGRIGRIPITLQGLLNVAHLGGKRGMSRFLATGGKYDPADSNGTHLSDYLALGARG